MSTIYAKLAKVQKELKVNKGQFNKFGKYYYRSAEDILEAAKNLCIENGLVIHVEDKINHIGERYYVEATASVIDIETSEKHSVTSSAREEETKKGMDGSQISGSASSYARKYAMNGLFAIDDTKDADATNEHGQGEQDLKDIKTLSPDEIAAKELGFGKHANKTYKEIYKMQLAGTDNYFNWLVENGNPDVKAKCVILRNAKLEYDKEKAKKVVQ